MMDNIILIALLVILPFMVAGCAWVCVVTWQAGRQLREMKRTGSEGTNGN